MRRLYHLFLIAVCLLFIYAADAPAADDASVAGANTTIFKQVALGDADSVASWLVSGGYVNIQDEDGNTPLLLAAEDGNDIILKLFLDLGADVNLANKYGYTPLFSAVANDHISTVRVLLSSGANANVSTSYGTSFLDYVRARGFRNMSDYIARAKDTPGKRGPNSEQYRPAWVNTVDNMLSVGDSTPAMKLLAANAVTEPYARYKLAQMQLEAGNRSGATTSFRLAADKGLIPAMRQTAEIYLLSDNKSLYSDGFRYAKLGADKKSAKSLVWVGYAYLYGRGVKQDYKLSYDAFSRAYEQRDFDGLHYIGLQEYYGLGVARNEEQGIAKMSSAEVNGSSFAREELKRIRTVAFLNALPSLVLGKRSEIKADMLTRGGILVENDTICDNYDVSAFIQVDYGIHNIVICADYTDNQTSENLKILKFYIRNNITDEQSKFLYNYATGNRIELITDSSATAE
ncbi:hypothetical protein RsTz2092_03780 [Deferribacterales bacterium RsTz2092]|nr:hypothetical protein AGMMS49941_02420 [Deferribacterales bacterium]